MKKQEETGTRLVRSIFLETSALDRVWRRLKRLCPALPSPREYPGHGHKSDFFDRWLDFRPMSTCILFLFQGARARDSDARCLEKILQQSSSPAEGATAKGRSADTIFMEVHAIFLGRTSCQRLVSPRCHPLKAIRFAGHGLWVSCREH